GRPPHRPRCLPPPSRSDLHAPYGPAQARTGADPRPFQRRLRQCCWCFRRPRGRIWTSCRGRAPQVRHRDGHHEGQGVSRVRLGRRRGRPDTGVSRGGAAAELFSLVSAVGELGRLAVELLRRGAAPRACETASRKLNIDVDTIQHGVEGLTYLLTESSKLMISETDFQDSIHVLGFSDELNKLLLQLYLENRKEIRSVLGELAPKLPSYHNLEWRLDVQLASRSLRQQIKPAVTIKLHLNENDDQTAHVLQTDPSTLLHLIQQLEQALGEMKTNHCRRIVRNMK
uniref:COMM domain containing 2 n=1 Tax=Amazona collaria TaxID=241587 RepID=A0A8B9IUT4_9PSIT